MMGWLRGWLQDRRSMKAARDALCEHDGSDPMCDDCAFFFNPPA